MKSISLYFLVCLPFLFAWVDGQSQVIYTSNGSCASNFGAYFTTAACWTKTSSCTPDPNIPPANGTVACPVIFDIEHEINIPNLTIGSNVNVRVNTGGKLNLSGNLSRTAQNSGSIEVNGGEFLIGGNLILSNGTQANNTNLNININSNSFFNVTGELVVGLNSVLQIDGDNTSSLEVGLISLAQRAIINILEGGRLVSNGETDYAGNNSEINVWGSFITESIKVTGGSGKQLNTFGNANVNVNGDVVIGGNGNITFGGDSDVYIDGNVVLNGGGDQLIIKENAKVVVCGDDTETDPPPGNVNKSNLNECLDPNNCPTGGYYISCRLLPVNFLYTEAKYSELTRITTLSWATSKEWENSHFEIERSINGVHAFQKVGEVQGMGWKDTLTEYIFEDNGIPLSGGIIYYRIKQVDFNGKFVYSKVLSVQASGVAFTKGVWRVFPNPTSGESFRLDILNPDEYQSEEIQVKLVSPSFGGQMVNGFELSEISAQLTDMLKNSPMGVYILEISWSHKIEHIKVLKK